MSKIAIWIRPGKTLKTSLGSIFMEQNFPKKESELNFTQQALKAKTSEEL